MSAPVTQQLMRVLGGTANLAAELAKSGSPSEEFAASQLSVIETLISGTPHISYEDAAVLAASINDASWMQQPDKDRVLSQLARSAADAVPNMDAGESLQHAGRRCLQDYTAFIHYLTPLQVKALQNHGVNLTNRAEMLAGFADKAREAQARQTPHETHL